MDVPAWMMPPRQKRYPGEPDVDPGGYLPTDEERERLRQELIAASGGQWNPDPTAPVEAKMPMAGGDMHNPGWGIERPGETGYPIAPLPPAQSGAFPMPQSWGTLGGAAGMGQPMSLYERGGGQSAYGGNSGIMAPMPGSPYGMGGIGSNIGRQSPTPYGMGRQSPTPYGMGRSSPTPYSGSGYSTLGGMSGYGRRY